MLQVAHPIDSLRLGRWFKLICGASYQHLPEIRNLALVFTLAGADCIDVAADPAVIHACQTGIHVGLDLAKSGALAQAEGNRCIPPLLSPPLLMVSLNDGEDPHFRKAVFDPTLCPSDCPRPCESICPAEAIQFEPPLVAGVMAERCYGCGRCLPICPLQQIETQTHIAKPETMLPLIATGLVSALEIHTQVGRLADFQRLWQVLAPVQANLQVLSISCPDHPNLLAYLHQLANLLRPLAPEFTPELIWQTDGRPMSGDIGDGTTRATVKLGQKVLAAGLPGYVQLAGGTNDHTVAKLRQLKLLRNGHCVSSDQTRYITGVAYGSFARTLLAPIQAALIAIDPKQHLEDHADLLQKALDLAQPLVAQIKAAQG